MLRTRIRFLTTRRRQLWGDVQTFPTMKTRLTFALALLGAIFLLPG